MQNPHPQTHQPPPVLLEVNTHPGEPHNQGGRPLPPVTTPTSETPSWGWVAMTVPTPRGSGAGGAPSPTSPPTSFLTVRSSLCRVSGPVGQDRRAAIQLRAGARIGAVLPPPPRPAPPHPRGPKPWLGTQRSKSWRRWRILLSRSRAAAAVGRGRTRRPVTSGPVLRVAPPPGNTLPGLPSFLREDPRSSPPEAPSVRTSQGPSPSCPTPGPHPLYASLTQCLPCARLQEVAEMVGHTLRTSVFSALPRV